MKYPNERPVAFIDTGNSEDLPGLHNNWQVPHSESKHQGHNRRVVIVAVIVAVIASYFVLTQDASAFEVPVTKACGPSNPCQEFYPGIPHDWCMNHPNTCDNLIAKAKKTHNAIKDRNRDTFRYETAPPKVRQQINKALNVNPKRGGSGGYGDWAEPADCTIHGYGCYSTANTYSFTTADKVIISCTIGVAVVALKARIPGSGATVGRFIGDAADRCLTGVAVFFGWLWGVGT